MVHPRRQKIIRNTLIYLAAAVLLVETLAPVAWMFISSISEGKDLLSLPPRWIPEKPTFERYQAIFLSEQVELWGATVTSPAAAFLRGLLNSILVAGATTVICLVLGLLASYALARLRFRGKQPILLAMIAVQMLPAIATVIPLFFMIRAIGLTDNPLSLILTYSGLTVTYTIWVLTGYLNNLPTEAEEAALIDGCSHLQALVLVTIPIAAPGLVAVGTLAFLGAWNEFLYALVFTHSPASKTLTVVISEFSSRFGLDYGMVMTGGVIAALPPILLALIFQRYIVRGLSAGAVKG
jgi:multiple sugar transport system permease protein